MRATLCDPELQGRLERDGYATFPMLNPDEVEQLRRSLDQLGPPEDDPHRACHSSFHSHDADYKRSVDEAVQRVLGPHIAAEFDRQRALPSNFIVKWPGGMSGFGLHQDLTLVDERRHRSVEVWVALDDTDTENGQLWMVPGSHRWLPDNIRGIHAFPFAFSDVARRIIERHAVPVPVRAGDAIVFTHAVLHFSLPNRSERPRRVAIADLIPEEAEHVHFFGDGDGTVEVFAIDDDFWTDNNPFTLWQPPPRSRCLGSVEREFRALTDEDLDHIVAEGRAVEGVARPRGAINPARTWCHRCGAEGFDAPRPDRWVGNVTLLCPACTAAEKRHAPTDAHVDPSESRTDPPDRDARADPPTEPGGPPGSLVVDHRPRASAAPALAVSARPVLVDRRQDHLLRRDGFVKVEGVVDPGVVAALRSAYGEIHGWEGSGFEPDLLNPDVAYRRAASDAIGERLDQIVGSLFIDHDPFLRNYLCKWPGPDSDLYLHRDWMYVDERRGERSYVAWIALDDIRGHNGQLRVLRGSHRVDAMLRGTSLEAPWLQHEEVIRDRLESVPVSAGDAIVFDNALVHCSYPNHTTTPRLVAAVGMRRRGVPLVYWRRSGSEQAERRDVDEEFFLTETPVALIDRAPSISPVEVAPTGEVEVSAARLVQCLDEVAPSGSGPLQRAGRWVSRTWSTRPRAGAPVRG